MSSKNNILDLHPWIDLAFVQMLVTKSDCDKNLAVTSFRAEKGVDDGKNFSSTAIRLHVNLLSTHDQPIMSRVYFLKVCLQTEDFAKACEECLYYEKEIEVYSEIIPAVEDLLQSIDIPARFTAKCFYTDVERGILAFEDLSVGNFVCVEPSDGMDKEHLKVSLSALAKWHATTAVLLLTRPELFDSTTRVMYKNAKTVRRFFESIAKTVSDVAKTWSGFEKIAEKLINVPSRVYDNIFREYLPTENGFNVLLHGDMWSNNIMFHYDQSGRPTDIRIVDFALCKHTNPSYDLALLLYGSSQSQSIGQADRERLIQFYHTELITLLEKLQYPNNLPTLIDIQTLVFRFDLYNVLVVLFVIGLRYMDKSFDGGFMELSDTQNTDGRPAEMYSQPKCIEELKNVLDLFDRRGYFDF